MKKSKPQKINLMKTAGALITAIAIVLTTVCTPGVTAAAYPASNPGATYQLKGAGSYSVKNTIQVGSSGKFDVSQSADDNPDINFYNIVDGTSFRFYTYDDDVLQVSEDGTYSALAYGEARVYASYKTYTYDDNFGDDIYYPDDDDSWDDDSDDSSSYSDTYNPGTDGYYSVTCWFYVYVSPDMSNVQLSETSSTARVNSSTSDYYSENSVTVSLTGLPDGVLLSDDNTDFSYTDSKNEAYVSLSDNVITISAYKHGKHVIKMTIFGKTFEYTYNVVGMKLSTCVRLALHSSQKLTVKNADTDIKWTSLNPDIASVSKSGVVKGKKCGTAVVTADIGGVLMGTVVNVQTASKIKAFKKDRYIAKRSEYSQPLRMQSGYYDCSSLVWKSYKDNGCNFGNAYYAPVAADEAKYLADRGRKVGKYTAKRFNSLKFQLGDLLFETGASNGRYKGIYHVEMFAGYRLTSIYTNSDGKVKYTVSSTWGNRLDGYYYQSGHDIICRP